MQFFENVKNAAYNFAEIGEWLGGLFQSVMDNATISGLLGAIDSVLAPIFDYRFFILMGLSLIVCLFGKRLLGIEKFLACFVVGFGLGVDLLAQFVTFVPDWVVGLVIGVVAALLFKIIYIAAVVVATGYSVYYIAFAGEVLPQLTAFTKGNLLFSIIAAVVAIVVVLLLLKWIEMLGTAFLGAYLFALALIPVFDIRTLGIFANAGDIPQYVLIAVIAVIGFFVQVKTRKRY